MISNLREPIFYMPCVVLALFLLLAVFGAGPGPGLDPDGPGGPEKP